MKNGNQDEITVMKQFEDQIKQYSELARAYDNRVVTFLPEWIQNNKNKLSFPIKICDFGGGGGALLNEINNRVGDLVILYNAELLAKYGFHQSLEKIHFVHTSVLDSKFESNFFDVVIIRDVLHHLIGKTLAKTRYNQCKALHELYRVTKPGGLIIIYEITNQSRLSCNMLYYASKLAAMLKLEVKQLEISPNTVVGFLGHRELKKICDRTLCSAEIIAQEYKSFHKEFYWKILLVRNREGYSFFALQKSTMIRF